MRKFIKFCIITACIMLFIGLVLGIGGIANGGGYEVIQMARSGELTFNHEDFDWKFLKQDDYEVLYDIEEVNIFSKEKEIFTGDISKIQIAEEILPKMEIILGGGTLEIRDSGDERIYLEAKNAEQLQAYADGDILKLKAIGRKIGKEEMKIYLFVPADVTYESIDLEVGAGLLQISNLQCKELEAGVGAGELRVNRITVNGDADFSVGAGHIQAQADVLGNLMVECSMGEADLALSGNEEDYDYEISCAAGKIKLGSRSFQGMSAKKEIDNGADRDMKLDCALGAINISFER